MSLFFDAKKASYSAQRAASHGAGITLVAKVGEYVATFDCATRAAEILGAGGLGDLADGLIESIPVYTIPFEDMAGAVQKLSQTFSVALVDSVCDKTGSRFVAVCRITPPGITPQPADDPKQTKLDLSDY